MELPGIEPSSEISLNWGHSGIDDAKRRQTTQCSHQIGPAELAQLAGLEEAQEASQAIDRSGPHGV
ncbi:hypothetical protein, partial [Mycobacterium sp.]|uniref:hypothetical protein n=1 Tax=Mycobacterium sp. TaxID=1785 RepID=UPI003CBF1104